MQCEQIRFAQRLAPATIHAAGRKLHEPPHARGHRPLQKSQRGLNVHAECLLCQAGKFPEVARLRERDDSVGAARKIGGSQGRKIHGQDLRVRDLVGGSFHGIRMHECEHLVAGRRQDLAQALSNEAGRAGDEYVHAILAESDFRS